MTLHACNKTNSLSQISGNQPARLQWLRHFHSFGVSWEIGVQPGLLKSYKFTTSVVFVGHIPQQRKSQILYFCMEMIGKPVAIFISILQVSYYEIGGYKWIILLQSNLLLSLQSCRLSDSINHTSTIQRASI